MATETEQRTIEIRDPALSANANHRLTEAVRDVLGTDRVTVPVGRTRVSEGQRPKASPLDRITSTKMMILGMIAVGVCVGLIVVTTGGHWIFTGIAFAGLALTLTAVTFSIIGLASTPEYPDPGLAALLSEEGVRDPEVRFSELVHEFTPIPEDGEHRSTAVEEDPARAAAEQTEAVTPSGGPSTAVGPGS
jgi:hypothetical protein